jgi:hypothetical protein
VCRVLTATALFALLLVLAFALWLTVHLLLCARLIVALRPKPLVALLLLPPTAVLAAYWGVKFGHKRLVLVWGLCLLLYAGAWLALTVNN